MSDTKRTVIVPLTGDLITNLKAIETGLGELATIKKELRSTTRSESPRRERKKKEPGVPRGTEKVTDANEIKTTDILKVVGEAGVFAFRDVAKDGGITCWGGTKGHEQIRTFPLERVYRVV